MTRLLLPILCALAIPGSQNLATSYKAEAGFRIEIESTFSLETVDSSMERDGEPMEGFGDMSSEQTRQIVMIDTILESEEGAPTRVRREFEALSSASIMTMGDREMDEEGESPLNGVVLELTAVDGEVSATVLEGEAPDDDALLEGHGVALALDALLPGDEVEADDSWEIDGDALLRATGFDIEKALFPAPEREEGNHEGGGEGGRGRGRRGPRGAPGAERYFANAEWDVNATLEAETEDHAGVDCLVITIKGEGSGQVPERERGGRDQRDGEFAVGLGARRPENSFEIELEGKLYFSVADAHPVHAELKATISTQSEREMNRRDSHMIIRSSQEGELVHTVDITPEAGE
ncbi:MAG: hypothetical protein ACI8X5_002128 [Planctomycetota bacterium]|jgi:hypothetical protein